MLSISWMRGHLTPWYLIPSITVANCMHCNTLVFSISWLKLHLIFMF
jgi:hypothetical protein